jgi:dihydroorotate dehydrogenase
LIYRAAFQILLRWLPPELAHLIGKRTLQLAHRLRLIRAERAPTRVRIRNLTNLQFANRLGIAAGFDKNAELVRELHALGFGHVEVGTVTAQPQTGNPKPRLFRLTSSQSLINRMGFNNDGAAKVARRLAELRASGAPLPIIGVNIGKTKVVSNQDAADDYQACARVLAPYADYLAVNVSSPNTPGLRELQHAAELHKILTAVLNVAEGKPILVKIAPDLQDEQVLEIAKLVSELGLAGLIVTNTSLERFGLRQRYVGEVGGYSGPLLASRSIEILNLLRTEFPGLLVVSVGGVSSRQDFIDRISLGAELVQLYTAFIYQGPRLARRWLR